MAAGPPPVWRLDISIPAAGPAFAAARAEFGGAMATDAPESGAVIGLQVHLVPAA